MDDDPIPLSSCIVWSIAGSDSGAGAGIQADLRAFDAFGHDSNERRVHGCTAIAAITAQNSVQVQRIDAVDPALLDAQFAALAADLKPAAIKTGMLGSAANLDVVVRWIDRLREADPGIALVVDPVLRASTGAALANDELIHGYRERLLPRATLVTPNRAEAAALLGSPALETHEQVQAAADALVALGCEAVAITGGDAQDGVERESEDFVLAPEANGWLALPRVETRHNHGTGCVFASSAAAALALGFACADAVVLAKMATTEALRHGSSAGSGAGAVRPARGFALRRENLPTLRSWGPRPLEPLRFAPLVERFMGLYAVVDSADWVERVLAAGVRCVQLRIKTPGDDLRAQIARSVAACDAAGAQLFVNDHWQLAIEERAYGVHLGQQDIETADLHAIRDAGLRLGLSSHAYWEVCRAIALHPSYIACGPVHATASKPMPWIPQGNGNLAYWSALLAPTPVVAIAGMDTGRAAEAVRAGAAGVAVITAITQSASPERSIAEFTRSIDAARREPRSAPPQVARPTLARRRDS